MLVKGPERMKLIRVEVSINQFDLGFESEETFRLSRLFALPRIKPHAPPLVRAPVNSFEF